MRGKMDLLLNEKGQFSLCDTAQVPHRCTETESGGEEGFGVGGSGITVGCCA
jgi:hypothetical protein